LFAGYQADGNRVYVGKVTDELGNFVPARIVPELNRSFYDENGEEKSSENIEYLFHNEGYEWWRSSGGKIVPEAVTVSGYYVGRAVIDETTIIGRIDLKAKKMIASHNGNVLNLSEYDVLVFKPSSKPLSSHTKKKNFFISYDIILQNKFPLSLISYFSFFFLSIHR
jgi:hypothetical protein